MNHNLNAEVFDSDILVPNKLLIERTNAKTGTGSIGAHVDLCKSKYGGRLPNSVILDFVDRGDPFGSERAMNGL